jgi:uncharacterized protein (TIGR00369 family)
VRVSDNDIHERIVRWHDPDVTAKALRDLSGIEALRAVMRGQIPPPPMARLLGFTLREVEEGRAVIEGVPAEYHYNPIGSVHGGFALTLFDSALACAVQSLLPAGVGYTTTDLEVRFIRAITKDTGTVSCEGKAVHVGRRTGVAEARLTDSHGKLLGIGSTACAIFRP